MPAYSLSRAGFVGPDGRVEPFLRLAPGDQTQEWDRKQQNSESQYHERLDALPEPLQLLYQLFDHYIAAAIWRAPGPHVLDIGCGIGRAFPPYAGSLQRLHAAGRLVYAGLDPLDANVESREYPFIHGRLEELAGAFEHGFDVFVFSTSLDHFEDIGRAAREVRRLANPAAIAIFWVGLHDARFVAELIGSDLLGRNFQDSRPGALLTGAIKIVARVPVTAARLAARGRRLAAARPLDDLHFHYFTADTLRAALAEFGTIVDFTRLPGSNNLFATVAVVPPAS